MCITVPLQHPDVFCICLLKYVSDGAIENETIDDCVLAIKSWLGNTKNHVQWPDVILSLGLALGLGLGLGWLRIHCNFKSWLRPVSDRWHFVLFLSRNQMWYPWCSVTIKSGHLALKKIRSNLDRKCHNTMEMKQKLY